MIILGYIRRELEASLGYMRPYLEIGRNKKPWYRSVSGFRLSEILENLYIPNEIS